MTITTYYAACMQSRSNAEAASIVHLINDLTAATGDNRSWDAMRAQINALADSDTQHRLGIVIEAEEFEHMADD